VSTPQLTPYPLQRIALAVEYDGSAYSGWQKQLAPELDTVQQKLEQALSQVADSNLTVSCAGRTDAGVHASCQVVHFDCQIDRGVKAWTVGVNSLLPESIRVLWAQPVMADFHARFSATARRYNYVLYPRQIASAILARRVTPIRQQLDLEAMNQAAAFLIGEQDFSAFRAAGCQSKTPFRKVMHASIESRGSFIVLDIKANAFLQHMVRNIVGVLLDIGSGKHDPNWLRQLLDSADRTQASATASPAGLYLIGVDYADKFGLPISCHLPPFLAKHD
jgi:tRNA pseudouridine38-40 synthase